MRTTVTLTGSFDSTYLVRLREALLNELAETTRDTIKASFGGPGPQQPSAPGETPNRQTDDLLNHVVAVVVDDDHSEVVSTRPSGDDRVPSILENGSPDGTRKARPYMRPGYEDTLRQFPVILSKAQAKAGKK